MVFRAIFPSFRPLVLFENELNPHPAPTFEIKNSLEIYPKTGYILFFTQALLPTHERLQTLEYRRAHGLLSCGGAAICGCRKQPRARLFCANAGIGIVPPYGRRSCAGAASRIQEPTGFCTIRFNARAAAADFLEIGNACHGTSAGRTLSFKKGERSGSFTYYPWESSAKTRPVRALLTDSLRL